MIAIFYLALRDLAGLRGRMPGQSDALQAWERVRKSCHKERKLCVRGQGQQQIVAIPALANTQGAEDW